MIITVWVKSPDGEPLNGNDNGMERLMWLRQLDAYMYLIMENRNVLGYPFSLKFQLTLHFIFL